MKSRMRTMNCDLQYKHQKSHKLNLGNSTCIIVIQLIVSCSILATISGFILSYDKQTYRALADQNRNICDRFTILTRMPKLHSVAILYLHMTGSNPSSLLYYSILRTGIAYSKNASTNTGQLEDTLYISLKQKLFVDIWCHNIHLLFPWWLL